MSQQQPARTHSRRSVRNIDVFVQQPNARGELVARQVYRVRPGEANVIVSRGYGQWRGRNKRAIEVHIPISALLCFIGQMRSPTNPLPTALDSRTFKFLGWRRGYKHVRNYAYAATAAERDKALPTKETN